MDADDQPYDLSEFDLEFNEQKDQGKVVLDDGSGDASGSFEKIDAVGGTFSYTLAPQVYSASGKCWFVLKQDNKIIDTTKDFYFDVEKEASIHIDNDNYVSSLQAEIDHFKATTQRVDEDWSNLKSTMDSGYQGYVSDFDKLKSDWQSQTAKINTDAQAQIDQIKADAKTQSDTIAKNASDQSTSIQTKADAQLKSQADTFSSTLADQVKQIETKRDKAISDATAQFTADVDSWTNQFNTWLTKTKSDYNSDIADLQSKLKTVQDGIDDVDTKRFPDMQAKVKQVQDAVDKTQANFDIIDFSSYAKKADIYTKQQIDSMVAAAGKLKSVSLNGGSKIQPDANGNADLTLKPSDQINVTYRSGGQTLTQAIDSDDAGLGLSLNADGKLQLKLDAMFLAAGLQQNAGSNNLAKASDILTLQDAINAITYSPKERKSLSSDDDMNDITETGLYRINGSAPKHSDNDLWCFAYVLRWDDNTIQQYIIGGRFIKGRIISAKTATFPNWEKFHFADITNLSNQLSALSSTANDNSNRLTKLESKGNGFVPITQADYDALTDDQKANGMYAIGDSN